jgi:hypothetical protein
MNTVSSLSKGKNNSGSSLTALSNFATKTVPNATMSALNSVSDFATETVPSATASALNSVSNFATQTVPSALNSVSDFAVNSATTTINSVAPIANSLIPFSTNSGNKGSNSKNTNVFTNVTNSSLSKNNSSKSMLSGWNFPIMILLVLVAIITTVMIVFKEQIEVAYKNMVVYFRNLFGVSTKEITEPELQTVTTPPTTPMDTTYKNQQASKSLVEKILPFGTNEVFNVSSNEYNYYDAEPLCKALGAELASYDQVKTAWENGADWCNYGWVKGQVAVYPTQKETWEKVQNGPEDERTACGKPGVNGGYFDNPEMRFGVNCYGKKPDQSTNDERILMKNGSIPKTADALKVDKMIDEFKARADKLGLLPFNNDKWESSV